MAALDGIGTLGSVPENLGSSGPAQTAETVASSSVKSAATTTAISAAVNDQTNVSAAAGLVATALNTSDVRQDKVTALQTAIANGSYNVPASAVAGKIVDSLLK
jgi:flagellar biosynthesis anti-sigma factor FlgM